MTAEAEPITARDRADVADRSTAYLLGQREDLGDSKHRPLARILASCPADPAGVAVEDLVILDRGHQDGAEQSVRLRRDRHRDAIGEQGCPPLADHPRGQPADWRAAKVRFDVLAEQPPVEIHRARAQARPFGDPCLGVLAELDLAPVRVGPVT